MFLRRAVTTLVVQQPKHQQLRCMSSAFELPVVSVAPFLTDASDPATVLARQEQAAKLDTCLKNVGFFYLTGHGVAPELLKAIRDQSRHFFDDAPDATKAKLAIEPGTGRGYVSIPPRQWPVLRIIRQLLFLPVLNISPAPFLLRL